MTNKTVTLPLADRLEDIAQDLTFMKDRNTIREAVALLAAPVVGRQPDAWLINRKALCFPSPNIVIEPEDQPLFLAPPELAELQATIARLTQVLEATRLARDAEQHANEELREGLKAAEQRNAELEDRSKLTNEQLIAIARDAALNSVHRYNYMPCLPEEAYQWKPHYWVIEAMRAVLTKPTESGASE